jgi:hypothetical protein
MYALNLDKDGRILSATRPEYASQDNAIVDMLPEGDISNYRYVDGEYIYDPIPVEVEEEVPSQLDVIEAQVAYTAMMTGTLLEV